LEALAIRETLEIGNGGFEKLLLTVKESGVCVGHETPNLAVAVLNVGRGGKEGSRISTLAAIGEASN
jgi:hypothetical protein